MGLLLLSVLYLGSLALQAVQRQGLVEHGVTWACGNVSTTPRLQYTSSSFAQMLVELFSWVLRPRSARQPDMPAFPKSASFHSEVPDVVLDEAVLPSFRFAAWLFSCFRVLQQGNVQTYLVYVFLVLIALLLWR
jgi:hydrogenase-4 component B